MEELKNKFVKCKKMHRCVWCSEHIFPNEKSRYRFYIFHGNHVSDYMHPECYIAMENSDLYDDEGFSDGTFLRGKTAEECDL